jgi:simple sugar transport system ATP-binding protein
MSPSRPHRVLAEKSLCETSSVIFFCFLELYVHYQRNSAAPPVGQPEYRESSPHRDASPAPEVRGRDAGEPVVEVRQITKRYGALTALRGVDLALYPGEVLGLVGDNGAGKSTLLNIIAGSLAATSGDILIGGEQAHIKSPLDARNYGIETVYQDLALGPDLSIWANLFIGRELLVPGPLRFIHWLDRRKMEAETGEDLRRTRIRVDSLRVPVNKLSGGQRQAVAVARAMAWGSRVLLLDEPTAALGVEQQDTVADLVKSAARRNIAVVLVSHNLPQVHALCDRICVLFHGSLVADLRPAEVATMDIVSWITGARINQGES